MSDNLPIVVSCEHATPGVPREYEKAFRGRRDLLMSHHGWDIGAVEIALGVARSLGASVHLASATRLLIDLNRSLHHPRLFSEISAALPDEDKAAIIDRYFDPFRRGVERDIDRGIRKEGRALHLSVHSFTPELDGEIRKADLSLLYDPSKKAEKELCERWLGEIHKADPSLRLRRNYPYRGAADGFTTYLRRKYGKGYLGIEVETNQTLAANPRDRERIVPILIGSLRAVAR